MQQKHQQCRNFVPVGQFTMSVLCVNLESLQSSEVVFTKDAIDE